MFNSDNTVLSNGVEIQGKFYPKKHLPSGTLRIVLTTDCNYRCIYCFAEGEPDKPHRSLDLEDLKKVLEVSREFGITNIKLTGGEPLCYPRFEELLCYLTRKFEYVDITTNASLLSSEIVYILNKYGVKALTISMNSLNKERYASLCKGVDLDVVIRNIDNAIVSFNGSIRVNCVIFDDIIDLNDYRNIIIYCQNNKIGMRIIEPSKVEGLEITYTKNNFYKLVDIMKVEADRIVKSDCESVEYLFFGDWYITVMYSLCDNRLCNTCKEYMYLRITSGTALKPCLSRNDTEVKINVTKNQKIFDAFVLAINAMGDGLLEKTV